MKKLHELEKKISLKFNDIFLLEEALTHSSYSNEKSSNAKNNEKMEFIGDAVLELVITDLLMKTYKDKTEGHLSKARSLIVSEIVLADVARELNLGNFIKLGKGETATGGIQKDSILSSVLEAICGAIYIDMGFQSVYTFLEKSFSNLIFQAFQEEFDNDYKTKLQEYSQAKYKKAPIYELSKTNGPAHNRKFEVIVKIDKEVAKGSGHSKKQAEQEAAKFLLKILKKQEENIA